MYEFSSENTFEAILQRMLDRVPNNLDKRQGSIIYDALAPAASELVQCYISLDVYNDQNNILTAVGENLDRKAADYGMSRSQATKAKRLGIFLNNNSQPMDVAIGSRFAVPNDYGGYIYQVISQISTGNFILECETAGLVGNSYFGVLLPISVISNLGTATLDEVIDEGTDTETDEAFRDRVLLKLREVPFGGNIAQYKSYVQNEIDGIKTCLVVPVWNGGGTVKVVPITDNYTIPTQAKINEIQTLLDPVQNQGQGVGLAPIGHIVTVSAPTQDTINIAFKIWLEDDYTLESIQDEIEEVLSEYIRQEQEYWDTQTTITIYASKISAAVSYIRGVRDVQDVQINDLAVNTNKTIYPRQGNNPFPVLGTITPSLQTGVVS